MLDKNLTRKKLHIHPSIGHPDVFEVESFLSYYGVSKEDADRVRNLGPNEGLDLIVERGGLGSVTVTLVGGSFEEIYKLKRVREDIATLKLGWKWPSVILDGVRWGRIGAYSDGIELNPERPHKRDDLIRSIFDRFLPSVRNVPSEEHDKMFQIVSKDLEHFADEMLRRTEAAAGDLKEHNKRIRLTELMDPIREALFDGVSVEAIIDLVHKVQAIQPNRRPTLEEVLGQLKTSLPCSK